MFHQCYNYQTQQTPRVIQFNSNALFLQNLHNTNSNFNCNNHQINYNCVSHQQLPYLVCQNSMQYCYPYQQNMKQYQQQLIQQQLAYFPDSESRNININNFQQSNQLSEQEEFQMDIEQSSFNEDQPQQICLLNFEKSRSGSQSECSWKSSRSINTSNIQIIQSVGKKITQIYDLKEKKKDFVKQEQSNEQNYHSFNPTVSIKYSKNYKEEDICSFQQQAETHSYVVDEQEVSSEIASKVENLSENNQQKNPQKNSFNEKIKIEKEKLYFKNLKTELLKLYNLDDETQLIAKIQEDLSQQCHLLQKKTEQAEEISTSYTNQKLEDQLSEQDIQLHLKCFKIDLSQEIPEIELTYMNLIKEINFKIFQINIQENKLFDDGTESKQNIRRKYALKVIEGIKKLVKGIITKRF
ncbi:hypothetical protein TTHERM_00628630 (macronuclear) [Tetrahymena thermophila SB210]|uniref:Uncharacterized protein n=1 Tax=Tetrahymena thermophila (strain SB210) TaxID=312017 RepID=Q23RT5_TETTS|nr:hypothetical protein TTHERM_00628630 [Tetrahymena thermophila SB210]EAR99304.2 hypothetical protein TTHERM_00628630 [Tetrahymena thermophila SB210]|eukprot:XP_001019549.2 hypothetical protein TTHERM_00628630 [Tetrahymena thermophila SB210]